MSDKTETITLEQSTGPGGASSENLTLVLVGLGSLVERYAESEASR